MTHWTRFTTIAVLVVASVALLALAGCDDDHHGPRYRRDRYYRDEGYDYGRYPPPPPPRRGFRPPPPKPRPRPYEDRDDYEDRLEDWEDDYEDWKDDRDDYYEDRYDD